jgi:hypothetical protein
MIIFEPLSGKALSSIGGIQNQENHFDAKLL